MFNLPTTATFLAKFMCDHAHKHAQRRQGDKRHRVGGGQSRLDGLREEGDDEQQHRAKGEPQGSPACDARERTLRFHAGYNGMNLENLRRRNLQRAYIETLKKEFEAPPQAGGQGRPGAGRTSG